MLFFLHVQESGGFFISTGGGGLNLPLDDDDDAFKVPCVARFVFFFDTLPSPATFVVGTWRMVSNPPIYKPFRPLGWGTTLLRG